MTFDYHKYSEEMDRFLLNMERIRGYKHPDITKNLEGLCDFLRIARIEVYLYESERERQQNNCDHGIIFAKGNADESRELTFEERADNGCIVQYHICPHAEEPDWTEVECSKITVLEKMLWVYNGRSRVMQLAEKLHFRDPGLGIYNLPYLLKQCEDYIRQGIIGGYVLGYFNLRRFANINQEIGRDRADVVMGRYINGVQKLLDEDELVGRIGGDNFLILFQKEKFDCIREYLKGSPVIYDDNQGDTVMVSATVGYYFITPGTQKTSEIMDNIMIAYGQAKSNKQESYVVYSDEIAVKVKADKKLEEQFPDALRKEEFVAYYQPKVSLKDYTLVGAEALCRWFHEGKMVSPGDFIPVLEQSRAITLLDFYMLDRVCRDIREWLDRGQKVVKVSVNFSRRHMGDENLVEKILETVDRYNVPHEYIEIELTETTTDVDFKDLREIVTALQKAGISTSVDDFGMGYSSLNLIKELPWNVLKIDRSLLQPVASREQSGTIMLSYIIAMAQEMGLECIVEGVETVEQVRFLKQHKCFLVQGFLFDRPLPKEEFEKRLAGI